MIVRHFLSKKIHNKNLLTLKNTIFIYKFSPLSWLRSSFWFNFPIVSPMSDWLLIFKTKVNSNIIKNRLIPTVQHFALMFRIYDRNCKQMTIGSSIKSVKFIGYFQLWSVRDLFYISNWFRHRKINYLAFTQNFLFIQGL